MSDRNITIYAMFELVYNELTVNTIGEGEASLSTNIAQKGDQICVNISPKITDTTVSVLTSLNYTTTDSVVHEIDIETIDNKYYFIMPSTSVEVKAVFKTYNKINDFTFVGNIVTSYKGNEEIVTLPESYSIVQLKQLDGSKVEQYFVTGNDYTINTIGENCFNSKSFIKEIRIPSTILAINRSAFQNMTSLESIVIPQSVKELGAYLFYGCKNLKNATIYGEVEILPMHLFNGCSLLSEIVMPNSIKEIEGYTFGNCLNLKYITLSSSLEKIQGSAFVNCSNLLEIEIPKGCTYIGGLAFNGNINLTKIIIPSSVTTIDLGAFGSCSNLKEVYYDGTIEDWCSIKFGSQYSSPFNSNRGSLYINNEIVENVIINSNINSWSFYGCGSIKSLNLDVCEVGPSAFQYCSNLSSITIQSNIKNINNNAFNGCNNLKTVIIENEYIYSNLTSTSSCGNLIQYATSIKVFKDIVNLYENDFILNNYKNKIDDGEYYIFSK